MALNDDVYDPNGTSNDALFNLVQGGFAFVAGKVAYRIHSHSFLGKRDSCRVSFVP